MFKTVLIIVRPPGDPVISTNLPFRVTIVGVIELNMRLPGMIRLLVCGKGWLPAAVPGVITYDDFAKVELRVAVIRTAEKVKGADKLLHLTVDAGDPEPRTIVAGIALAYPDPAALVGRRIVVAANLAPRPLRGITSQGMLLAAGEAPNLQLVTVGEGIAPGTRVK